MSAALPAAERNAPSETPLTAQSAQSVVSGEFIRNFTSPVADFAEVAGAVLKLVYTLRGGAARCISLRPASKRERKAFDEIRAREKN